MSLKVRFKTTGPKLVNCTLTIITSIISNFIFQSNYKQFQEVMLFQGISNLYLTYLIMSFDLHAVKCHSSEE